MYYIHTAYTHGIYEEGLLLEPQIQFRGSIYFYYLRERDPVIVVLDQPFLSVPDRLLSEWMAQEERME